MKTYRTPYQCLIGTVPAANPYEFPYHMTVLIANKRTGAAELGLFAILPDVINGIFSQTGAMKKSEAKNLKTFTIYGGGRYCLEIFNGVIYQHENILSRNNCSAFLACS